MITPQAASTSQALVDALLDARRVELEPRNGDEAYLYALAAQHQRIHTAQIYASIRPTQLKRSVEFLETKASRC